MPTSSGYDSEDELPWSIGVFDSHCHPTDTMSAVPDISKMKAKSLVIMATRKQDQQLVSEIAKEQGLQANHEKIRSSSDWRGVVPAFGWHPWFSHQVYDDAQDSNEDSTESAMLDRDGKIAHYQSVLTPKTNDHEFLTALPDPIPLSQLIQQIKEKLQEHPSALVGEIGLDKGFRIPEAWLPGEAKNRDESLTPGGREGRRLSPYRVSMEHQRKILLAQLNLAGSMQRAVSVHGVQAHGIVFETLAQSWKGQEKQPSSKRDKKRCHLKEPPPSEEESSPSSRNKNSATFPPRVCLHSYSGPPDTLRQYLQHAVPAEIFFSFSSAINFSHSAQSKTEEVIKALPDDRILIESDLHQAGQIMDDHLEDIMVKICKLKNWKLVDGVTRLGNNWKNFVFGIPNEQ